MIQKINGEQPFQILSDAFTIGPSQTGYDLQISANGTDYSTLFSVAANTTRLVNNVSNGAFFRLKNNVGEVDVNWRTTCKSGGSGGGSYVLPTASETVLGGVKVGEGLSIDGNGVLSSQGGGSIDSGAVLSLVNSAITDFSNDLQEGEPIVGMAKQLYSPDGVTSEGVFAYRTTAGDADVSSAPAELRKIEGNSIYPELQYNDSAALEREGEPVTGFTYDIGGNIERWVNVEGNEDWTLIQPQKWRNETESSTAYMSLSWRTDGGANSSISFFKNLGQNSIEPNGTGTTAVTATELEWDNNMGGDARLKGKITIDGLIITATITAGTGYITNMTTGINKQYWNKINVPNDIPVGESTYTYDGTPEWITYVDTAQTATILPKMGRMKLSNYPYPCIYINNTTLKAVQFRWDNSTSSLTPNSNFITVVETNRSFTFSTDNVSGTVTYDGEWLTLTIESTDGYVRSFEYGLEYQIYTETFAWTPSLPQAISNMKIDGVDYVPEDGDEITITRVLVKNGTVQNPHPSAFVSVGLNSFCKESATAISDFSEDNGVYTVTVYAVAGLEAGYVVYDQNSGITAAGIGSGKTDEMDSATTVYGEALSVVYPTTAKPYIIVTTTDIDGLCIHPRWSGYNDEVYEPYEESRVEGLIDNTNILYSVGNTRDIWDLEKSIIYRNIDVETYSAARVSELLSQGKVLGVDFDFDTNSIFIVRSETSETPVTPIDYSYKANDFGVEYYVNSLGEIPSIPLPTETYYMNNLVDKLRRMKSDYIILDNLDGQGEEGQLYSYNNRLMRWVNGAGRWGKWIIAMDGNARNQIENLGGYAGGFSEYSYLIYTYLPFTSTTLLCRITIVATDRYVGYFPTDNKLKVFDNISLTGTPLTEISMNGVESDVLAQNRHMYISWADGKIIFRNGDTFVRIVGNLVDTSISTGHYEALDFDYFDGTAKFNQTAGAGFVLWNSEGKVVDGWQPAVANTYVNTTGYSPIIKILNTGSSNMPNRFFVPTQAGTSGQILTSAGGGEPTWSNWIKSVQITSDEYEALATKDPSVLYLIVDE